MTFEELRERFAHRLFWVATFGVLAMSVGVFVLYTMTPVDGYQKNAFRSGGLRVTGQIIPEARGLVPGDRIVAIDGELLPRAATFSGALKRIREAPATAVYLVDRNGQLMTVEVPLNYLPPVRLLMIASVHFALSLLFIVFASILYLRAGPVSSRARTSFKRHQSIRVVCFALVCGAANIIGVTDLSVGSAAEWPRLLRLIVPVTFGFTFGLLLHFFLLFPPRKNASSRTPGWAYLVHASHLSLSIPAVALIALNRDEPLLLLRGRQLIVAVFIACALTVAFRSYRRLASPVERNQMRWLAWGSTVGIGPWAVFFLGFSLAGLRSPIDFRLLLLLTAVIPLSLVIAITRYRLLEIDGLIRRSLVYTLVMAAMSALYLVAVVVSAWLLQLGWGEVNNLARAIMSAMLLALAFHPLKVLSERLVARLFYQGVVDPAEGFATLSRAISQLIRLPELAEVLTKQIPRAFAASGAALIVVNDGKAPTILTGSERLRDALRGECERLASYFWGKPGLWQSSLYPVLEEGDEHPLSLPQGMALCFPMSVGGKLTGLYLLGEKLSNRLYTRPEMDTLRTLAHHAATALENASAYQRLNDLNAELEVLVELRTQQLQRANTELELKNTDLVLQNEQLADLVTRLRETQAALVEAERMAAVGEIIITICHEINNPLSAIIGQAQLIQMRSQGIPEAVIERVKVIDQCGEKIRELTERMRKLSTTRTVTYAGQAKMIDLKQEQPEEDQSEATPRGAQA